MIKRDKVWLIAVFLIIAFSALVVSANGEDYSTGDPNCSGNIDIDDVVYLIAYIFGGGPAPCNPSTPSGIVIGNLQLSEYFFNFIYHF